MVMESLYASCLFLGVNNAASIQTIVSIERTVFYREKAAEMYSPIPFAVAQENFCFILLSCSSPSPILPSLG
ncbi:hypothetical protein WN944_027856 [Citrus x changshan-huyou]|uniref:ABC-2 type transporter transmembrane domain-containing protein n=1 Tax=Citrus x changshan-huyou TaxID=2935761 RepID=A0AAP0LIS1_9ROSI